jgi:uncharacterized membrane protein YebE (DUF533 family)
MNSKQILDMLLNSGKELAEKGKTLAEAKLGLPDDPKKRDELLVSASKGAIAASALAVLLGTGAGRKLTGATLKLGSLAAIGGIAYKAFQDWQAKQTGQVENTTSKPVNELTGAEGEKRSNALLKAMIASAKADGHIDDKEKAAITQHASKLGLNDAVASMITDELAKPLDVNDIAAGADSPEAAAEIYLVSRMVLDMDNDAERQYLDKLASALKLAPDLIAQLEKQVMA